MDKVNIREKLALLDDRWNPRIVGMCRSVGIPARFAVGLPPPAARGAGEIPGYHCWAELHVGGRGWVPVDASEAARHPEKRAYSFVYPCAEVDGRPHQAIERKWTFIDRERPATGPGARP